MILLIFSLNGTRLCAFARGTFLGIQRFKPSKHNRQKAKKALIYKALSVVGLVGLEPMTSTMSILVIFINFITSFNKFQEENVPVFLLALLIIMWCLWVIMPSLYDITSYQYAFILHHWSSSHPINCVIS